MNPRLGQHSRAEVVPIGSRGQILCIDDDVQTLNLIEQVLASMKVRVLKAITLDDGLAMVLSHRPDVIILDRIIGDEDGRTVLSSIARLSPKPKVLVLSGFPSCAISPAHQPDAYLAKPISPSELRRLVDQLLVS